jgi:hypothetical protein
VIDNKFILNSTFGINGIEKISLKDIIKVFSFPTEIEIQSNESKIDFSVNLKYNKLKVYYTLYYFVEDLKKPENHSLTYRLEKLYLNKNENIKVGDDIRKVLPKIKKYLKKNRKSLKFEYEFSGYYGNYLFDDGNITIFFEKKGREKIVDGITISLPYEDILPNNYIVDEIENIIEIKNKIDSFFWK